MKSYTTLRNLWGKFTQNNSATNLTLGDELMNDSHRYLLQKYFNNEKSYTRPTVASQQAYKNPPNYSKNKTLTVTIGQIKYTPIEIQTREEWDRLNFITYTSDIPAYYFIYNGQTYLYPTPSSSGNTITWNYKIRVPDLNYADYTTGTASVSVDGTAVTGVGTTWQPTVSTSNESRWIRFTFPSGDGAWYQIDSVNSTTGLTLETEYEGSTAVSGGAYTIGQMPLLLEDFHDLIVFRPVMLYYSSILEKPTKAAEFKTLYDEGVLRMNDYSGSKTTSVVLDSDVQMINPNLFYIQ